MIYRLSEVDLPRALGRYMPRPVAEWAIGLLITAAVVVLRQAIDLIAPGAVPFALIFVALLLATVVGGWRTGLITAFSGGLLVWYWIIPPIGSFVIHSTGDGVSLALYVLSSALIVWIAHGFRVSSRVVTAERSALAESERRFRLMGEEAPINLWVGDAQGACVYLNRAQRQFWGVGDDLAGFQWGSTLLPEDAEHLYAAFNQAMAAFAPFEVEARYLRADGAVRTLRTVARPRFGGDGAFLGMIGVNIDVTDARDAQHRQDLLVHELNHRVKNTLATVQALTRQTLHQENPAAAVAVFEGRLLALSAAHDVLTRQHWEAAPVGDIVAQAVGAYQDGGRIETDGLPVHLAPRAVLGLSMALHELATNAVKYGALSRHEGRVAISWREQDGDLFLEWRESDGPPVVAPRRQGFGARLLTKGLSGDLGSAPDLIFDPAGVICRFRIPIEADASP